MDTLLKHPYIAPNGQRYLQNGRYITIDSTMIKIRIPIFQLNRKPIASCSGGLADTSGIPPNSVPEGQIHLQNQGSPFPRRFTANIGSMITNTTRIMYFRYFKYLSPGTFRILPERNLMKQILNKSKRTQPPADKATEESSKCHQKTNYIERELVFPAAQHRLKRTNGA